MTLKDAVQEKAEEDTTVSIPKYSQTYELLNHTQSKGLQVDYKFSRLSSIYGENLNAIELIFTNKWNSVITDIRATDLVILYTSPLLLQNWILINSSPAATQKDRSGSWNFIAVVWKRMCGVCRWGRGWRI
jgi:hypothetical protein